MEKEFLESVESAFGAGNIDIRTKNLLMTPNITEKALKAVQDIQNNTTEGLSGSKLSVFLEWLFSDPQRVLDLLLKIIGIFSAKEGEQKRY